MPFKIGNGTIKDIYVGSDKIDKIYVGSDLVYGAITSTDDLRFNYVGIDANGNDEGETAYDGTAVAYGIGQLTYSYYRYTQVSPTPTTASDYASKYVYNEETGEYSGCSYSGETLSPSWVVVGTTPCYTREAETYAVKQTETQTLKFSSSSPILNGAFNTTYWGEGIRQSYDNASQIPEITELKKLALPTTYRGLPITKILPNAFYGFHTDAATIEYYPAFQMEKVLISSQNISLHYGCFKGGMANIYVTSATLNFYTRGFDMSSSGFFDSTSAGSNPNSLVLDATVTSVSGSLISGSKTIVGSLVFKHSQNDNITLSINSTKNAVGFNYIYTDCDAVRNYDWSGKNITVNFKTLSEYTGDLNYED